VAAPVDLVEIGDVGITRFDPTADAGLCGVARLCSAVAGGRTHELRLRGRRDARRRDQPELTAYAADSSSRRLSRSTPATNSRGQRKRWQLWAPKTRKASRPSASVTYNWPGPAFRKVTDAELGCRCCVRVRSRKTRGRLALSAPMDLRSGLPPHCPAKAASRCTETAAPPPRCSGTGRQYRPGCR